MASKEHRNGYWTKERCAIEALKYHRSTDFREGNQAVIQKFVSLDGGMNYVHILIKSIFGLLMNVLK